MNSDAATMDRVTEYKQIRNALEGFSRICESITTTVSAPITQSTSGACTPTRAIQQNHEGGTVRTLDRVQPVRLNVIKMKATTVLTPPTRIENTCAALCEAVIITYSCGLYFVLSKFSSNVLLFTSNFKPCAQHATIRGRQFSTATM